MKHIFVVHSYINYIVARLVIAHKNLSYSEVVFVPFRGFQPLEHEQYTFSKEWHYPYDEWGVRYIRFSRQKLKEIISFVDNWVEHYVGESTFQIYAAYHSKELVQILSTHKQSKGIYAIEDGYGSFKDYQAIINRERRRVGLRMKLKNFIKAQNRLVFNGFISSETLKCYALSDYAFLNAPNKVIVNDRILLEKIAKEFSTEKTKLPENSGVIVFESLVELKRVNLEEYIKSTLLLIDFMKNNHNCKHIYIKFHPAQKTDNRKQIKESLAKNKQNVNIVYLEDSVCIELLMIQNKNVKVFGFTSSLLMYSKILIGSKGYSIMNHVKLNKKLIVKMEKDFKDNVIFIE